MNPEAKNTFTITRGFEKCIFLYPLDTWEKMEEGIEQLNMYQKTSRDFVRSIMRWAEEVQLDAQGRVSIPKALSEYAALSDKVQIMGALDHVEIWDPDGFTEYSESQVDDYETLAENVMGK